jgi:hypothetical protein
LQKKAVPDFHSVRSPAARLGPEKISIARLPVTGSNFFGREADIAFLDEAWGNQRSNVVTIVAWAGAGKSTLVNQWLLRMAAEHYRSAELVFGWSFYRQAWLEQVIEDYRAAGALVGAFSLAGVEGWSFVFGESHIGSPRGNQRSGRIGRKI